MADSTYNILGFEIKRKRAVEEKGTVVVPVPDDGATVVNNAAAYYGMVIDLEGVVKNENDLIRRYRECAQYSDCDTAIEDIVNDAIVVEPGKPVVSLVLDDIAISENIKNVIRNEFNEILRLYKFPERAHDIFRQWYVDGRLFYHIVLDESNPQAGIQDLRVIDPRKIRRIKNVKKEKNALGVEIVKTMDEFFLYNDKGITEQTTQGIKLSLDSVVHCTSGLKDSNTNMVLGYLHKAIKLVNQLKMMEDALVIYRISRAPERRVFYIDVGNLPKLRAEQYVTDMMTKFRNKVVYDAATGEVKDNRQHLSLIEDFWIPRRGNEFTKIDYVRGGDNLGKMEDVNYFQAKLYQALNVPRARLDSNDAYVFGSRAPQISREELKFNRFIERLRVRFADIFRAALRVQLIAKQIIKPEEWDSIDHLIRFEYQRDNYFAELKDSDIMNNRLALLGTIHPYVGLYYSSNWVRKNVLHQDEQEMQLINAEMQYDIQLQQQQQALAQQQAQQQGQQQGQQ